MQEEQNPFLDGQEIQSSHEQALEQIEIGLLLEGIYRHYGHDFREYASASLKRRIQSAMQAEKVSSISALQAQVLHDPACMKRFLLAVSVNVTAMYRDPGFFLAFRQRVIPLLRTYPFVRLWHAGCSTGEEVYSMAILLQEEGLYDRCRIYATDMDETVLKQAMEGIFPLSVMQSYQANYARAGGTGSLADYYTSGYGSVLFRASLRDNMVFSPHNLAVDSSFNEFHVILCRNVMIYFTKPLQRRVHDLLYDSLVMFGILGIGSKESLHFTSHENAYESLDREAKLYRRIS